MSDQHPDWLYQLIFAQAAELWRALRDERGGPLGAPAERFLIQECGAADWEAIYCGPSAVRMWRYDGLALAQLALPWPTHDRTLRGSRYAEVLVRFAISADGRQVAWNHVAGPRMWRGLLLQVVGGPEGARLERERASEWGA